jgi:hypothetical protein
LVASQTRAQSSAAADTVPRFAFAIDPAAIAAGMRPLRATSLPKGEREIRVWTGFGLGIPHDLYRLRVSGKNMRGALILWWSHDGEWGPSDAPESMHAYVRRVFGCERIRQHEQADTCEGDFGRRPPDWRRVLARMDSLGVNTLQTPAGDPLVFDGYHMVVETLDATGYRTAYFSMPSANGPGDTPRAHAILEVLQRTRQAAVRDSTLKRR